MVIVFIFCICYFITESVECKAVRSVNKEINANENT
jgi:hypothetical protein